jgi:hypothetical protein
MWARRGVQWSVFRREDWTSRVGVASMDLQLKDGPAIDGAD